MIQMRTATGSLNPADQADQAVGRAAMSMTGPVGHPVPPVRHTTKRPRWVVGGATILIFVTLLYVVELIDYLSGHALDSNGIRPWQADGLPGIVFAPMLHANWQHLIANTVPLLVLGFLMTLAGLSRFMWATAMIWILGGFGTWLIGNLGGCGHTVHIGASGLIFGWLAFLVVFGIFARQIWDIGLGLMVLIGYGGILLGAVPVLDSCGGVSWQGHLCGVLAGVLAAYVLTGPERNARAQRKAAALSPHQRT